MSGADSNAVAVDAQPSRWGLTSVFVLVVAAAGALRWSAAQDEFWLDEIWSLVAFVRNPHTFRDIFTFHHDNNHYLVTMWMDLVGPHMRNWVWYRVPSIVAGVGTVILAARIALRWGRTAAFCAVLLTTTSFVLILYASEARGYALAGFFSLVAFLALESYLRIPSVGAAACFAAAALLGALSHLTFIQFYAGACAWTVVAMLHDSAPWRQRLLRTVAVHGAPFALLLGLYFLDVRDMRIGGGDDYQLLDVVTRALALAMGCFAEDPLGIGISALIAAFFGLAGIFALWREKSDLWAFFAGGFIVAPALLFALQRPTLLYERYFYLNTVYYLILLSYLFARLCRGGSWMRSVAAGVVTFVILGNVEMTADFLQTGRGHYLAALRYIEQQTTDAVIQIAGDDDFDNTLYLGFYVDYLPPGRQFAYADFRRGVNSATPPEWLFLHSQERPFHPEGEISLPGVTSTYRLLRVYPCGRLSGYQFALYRRN